MGASAVWGFEAGGPAGLSRVALPGSGPQAVLARLRRSQTARFMLSVRLASPIFTVARASPIVRTTSPIGPF